MARTKKKRHPKDKHGRRMDIFPDIDSPLYQNLCDLARQIIKEATLRFEKPRINAIADYLGIRRQVLPRWIDALDIDEWFEKVRKERDEAALMKAKTGRNVNVTIGEKIKPRRRKKAEQALIEAERRQELSKRIAALDLEKNLETGEKNEEAREIIKKAVEAIDRPYIAELAVYLEVKSRTLGYWIRTLDMDEWYTIRKTEKIREALIERDTGRRAEVKIGGRAKKKNSKKNQRLEK